MNKTEAQIPSLVISLISKVLADSFSSSQINECFMYANAPGGTPISMNKLSKCHEWLSRCNSPDCADALNVLGNVIKYIERYKNGVWQEKGYRIIAGLSYHNLNYIDGAVYFTENS